MSVSGGAAVSLAFVSIPNRGAAWDAQRSIVFSPAGVTALQRISDAGGKPQPLIEDAENHIWLYDVRRARDKFDLLRFDASRAVSSGLP